MTSPLIVVMGATGQLGQTLSRRWSEFPLCQYQFKALDRSELDLNQVEPAMPALAELRPSVIVNAAAHTQVDTAESDSIEVHRVNA